MAAKEILYDTNARDRILAGLNALADAEAQRLKESGAAREIHTSAGTTLSGATRDALIANAESFVARRAIPAVELRPSGLPAVGLGLFAFFVVMYAISTLNEGKYRVLADSLVTAFRNDPMTQPIPMPAVARTTLPPPRPRTDPVRKQKTRELYVLAMRINNAMAPLVQTGQVRLTQLPHGLAVEINASEHFAPC
jgi:hypothetical protein